MYILKILNSFPAHGNILYTQKKKKNKKTNPESVALQQAPHVP